MPTEIVRLTLENPLQGDPGQAIAQATREEAEARRIDIRTLMTKIYVDWVPLIRKAYVHRDWVALGYAPGEAGWEAYCQENFHPDALLPRETRTRMIAGLRFGGMSNRAVASAVGTSEKTVRRETKQLRQDAADEPDATVLSLDGKRRPAAAKVVEPDEIYVPEREREWADVEPSAPPVIFSGTPGGATAETPDTTLRNFAGWQAMAATAVSVAVTHLNGVTGEFTDPGTFAAQADDQLMSEVDKLSRRLHAFVLDVWALRGRWVWMSAQRPGLEWHVIGNNPEQRALAATTIDEGGEWDTECGRSTAGGVAMSEVRAVQEFGAKPCAKCQEAMS